MGLCHRVTRPSRLRLPPFFLLNNRVTGVLAAVDRRRSPQSGLAVFSGMTVVMAGGAVSFVYEKSTISADPWPLIQR